MSTSDALSGILGWISIATWVVVYSPQIYENWRLKSGEGLSVPFVVIWLLGDLCNLVGASMAGLLPTVIILALYYTLCDTILLVQIYYYRWASRTDGDVPNATFHQDADEEAPLLASSDARHPGDEKHSSMKRQCLEYSAMVVCVVAAGVAAWAISEKVGHVEEQPKEGEVVEWRSQLMGYISAVLYLGSRVPQILKNLDTKCEGLSPAMFVFSIMGNVTYGLSICVSSMEWEHLVVNASWLAGSLLTVFLDVLVLGQFVYYRRAQAGSTVGQVERREVR
ncbi:PQ-loop-domain-containing protein [Auriscalpium vulgare]|uniref:PQ-loop-domain-containing protein n=1 Tax=Auriscalpium vulgare TaxID=40419 RepID=A0ACB8S8T2_9AGAM|nr:PQ-loop-domain-containing protein [Auriscalpium vulgare]